MAGDALSILTIGGLSLLFIMYFGRSFCTDAPSGGPFCFNGFNQSAKGAAGIGAQPKAAPVLSIGSNCRIIGNQACWFGAGGQQSCTTFNPKVSDAKSASGRNTLCSRVRNKFIAEHRSNFAMAYIGNRLSMA